MRCIWNRRAAVVPSLQLSDFVASYVESLWDGPSHSPHDSFDYHKVTDELRRRLRGILSHLLVVENVSFTALILATIYTFRLREACANISGSPGCSVRIAVVSLILACKYFDDHTAMTNSRWATLTKVPLGEINAMEIEFLERIKYNLHVSSFQYDEWLAHLEQRVLYEPEATTRGRTLALVKPAHSSSTGLLLPV